LQQESFITLEFNSSVVVTDDDEENTTLLRTISKRIKEIKKATKII